MHLLVKRWAPSMQPALHKVKGVGRTWMLNGCACKGLLCMYAYVCEYVKAGGSGSLKHSMAVTVGRGELTVSVQDEKF